MAGVNIDPIGEHESRPEEPTDETFLLPLWEEDGPCRPEVAQRPHQLGNQNVNKKHHSEEEKAKEPN